jgi:hypothetical protein
VSAPAAEGLKPRPNPLAVRYSAARGWFVWSSLRERAISKYFDTKEEAEHFFSGLPKAA